MLFGVLSALAAAACFAVAAVLQQRAAATRPPGEVLSPRLLLALAREPLWLAGVGTAALSYAVQAVALSQAPLAVVQPILACEVVFAIPLSVRLRRVRLRARDWVGVFGVGLGLAVSIALADPRGGTPLAPLSSWVPVVVPLGVGAAAAAAVGRAAGGTRRPMSFALSAAVLTGLEAALMAATTRRFEGGVAAGFTAWEPYAMAVCSITATLMLQSAFESGPLAVSLPIVDAVAPLLSIVIGLTLFGEQITGSPARLGLAAIALAVLLGSIVTLDTSPLVQRAAPNVQAQRRGSPTSAPSATTPTISQAT
ncbi:MAG TPA: DMT family transporter [Mycobacteriales bacterium]|nr:DMT family transporter [Mycobacteriales bacterium]